MIRTVKPKNARSKRALAKKEAKIVENTKQALFVPGSTATKLLHDVMVDLAALKKPDVKRFQRKNELHPFDDIAPLEFFAEKNDCSLIVFASSSKKRPNCLTFARFFDYRLYDMVELLVTEHKLLTEFKKRTFTIGLKPMFTFNGTLFDTHDTYKHIKSLFLDFYRGEITDLQDVAGLQYIISISAAEPEEDKPLPEVHFRVYALKTYRTGQKLPRVELDEIGPRLDFKIGRVQEPSGDMQKEAMRKPRQLEPKTKKNISTDLLGDKVAQIHVGNQDLGKLQTRKMKGLKSKFDQEEAESGEEYEGEYEEEEEIEAVPKSKKVKV